MEVYIEVTSEVNCFVSITVGRTRKKHFTKRAGLCRGKSSALYSGVFHFESLPGLRLPWFRIFGVLLDLSRQMPDSFQTWCNLSNHSYLIFEIHYWISSQLRFRISVTWNWTWILLYNNKAPFCAVSDFVIKCGNGNNKRFVVLLKRCCWRSKSSGMLRLANW
jgi:hypothetical protein